MAITRAPRSMPPLVKRSRVSCNALVASSKWFSSTFMRHSFDYAGECLTRILAESATCVLFKHPNSILLLKVVQCRSQRTGRLFAQHAQMHQRFSVQVVRSEFFNLIKYSEEFSLRACKIVVVFEILFRVANDQRSKRVPLCLGQRCTFFQLCHQWFVSRVRFKGSSYRGNKLVKLLA